MTKRADTIRLPNLVQRARVQEHPSLGSVFEAFRMDYMGAAEFEGPTLRNALDKMYTHRYELTVQPISVATDQLPGGRHAYFLGLPLFLDTAALFLFAELGVTKRAPGQREPHEPAYLAQSLDPTAVAAGSFKPFDAWWVVDGFLNDPRIAPVPWMLFRTETHARLWQAALAQGK